jgi:KDO2-lipid IV(A) lauroyltransferase
MYRDLGLGLAELLWLAGTGAAERAGAIERVVIEQDAIAALEDAALRGPVIIFASHTGNWELAAAAAARLLARRGKRLVVVAKAMHARGVDRFTSRLRSLLGLELMAPAGALEAARRSLHEGHVVVMPIDQVPDRSAHATRLPFLGEVALVDRAPATLAWRARATVLVVASVRDGDRHRVRLLEVVTPRESGQHDARAWIDATTARATSKLDAFVRTAPESWLWLHRRWRMPRREQRVSARGATGASTRRSEAAAAPQPEHRQAATE